jgi:hypothetical protein
MNLPQPDGIVAPLIITLALLRAAGRTHRAACENHRYRFATWRWGRGAAALLVVGLVLRPATAQ